MANGNFTNGALVFRIWRFDGGCELIGKFQYRQDAEEFARFYVEQDGKKGANKDGSYFYLVACEYECFAKAFGVSKDSARLLDAASSEARG